MIEIKLSSEKSITVLDVTLSLSLLSNNFIGIVQVSLMLIINPIYATDVFLYVLKES